MIIIKLTLWDTEEPDKQISVDDGFRIENGYSRKYLFALYQRARAKLGVTKYGKSQKGEG